jgi:predicted RNA-binding protein YlqC (UPF0109 family)
MNGRPVTDDDRQVIKAMFPVADDREIGEMIGRTGTAVEAIRHKMGLLRTESGRIAQLEIAYLDLLDRVMALEADTQASPLSLLSTSGNQSIPLRSAV